MPGHATNKCCLVVNSRTSTFLFGTCATQHFFPWAVVVNNNRYFEISSSRVCIPSRSIFFPPELGINDKENWSAPLFCPFLFQEWGSYLPSFLRSVSCSTLPYELTQQNQGGMLHSILKGWWAVPKGIIQWMLKVYGISMPMTVVAMIFMTGLPATPTH